MISPEFFFNFSTNAVLTQLLFACCIYYGLYYMLKHMVESLHIPYSNTVVGTLKFLLIIPFVFSVLNILHIDASGLLASLGVVGIVIGYSLKDIIGNAVSGLMMRVYSPFKIGDTISICGVSGAVVSIGIRYTVIKSPKEQHFIPNTKVFSESVTLQKSK